jgi:hypothetical protein
VSCDCVSRAHQSASCVTLSQLSERLLSSAVFQEMSSVHSVLIGSVFSILAAACL